MQSNKTETTNKKKLSLESRKTISDSVLESSPHLWLEPTPAFLHRIVVVKKE